MKSTSFEIDVVRAEVLARAVGDLQNLLLPLRLIMLLNERVHAARSVDRSLRFLSKLTPDPKAMACRATEMAEEITVLRKLLWGVGVSAVLAESDACLGELKYKKAVTQAVRRCDVSLEEIAQILAN